jgi:hypothetical protein
VVQKLSDLVLDGVLTFCTSDRLFTIVTSFVGVVNVLLFEYLSGIASKMCLVFAAA